MFAHINGTKIFFDVEGVGISVKNNQVNEKPVCFILHGGPGSNHLSYKNGLTPISEFMQLVYVDNRGGGYSDISSEDKYTIDQNIEDLEALRKYLGLEKVSLLGHSYGGMVAMKYATKYPESIQSLILVTTSPHHSFIEDAKKELMERGTPEQIKIAEHVWDGDFTSVEQHIKFQNLLAPMYSITYNEDAPKQKRKGRFSFQALNKGFGGFLRSYDVTQDIKKLNIPVLVIGAAHDWITPVSHSYWIADLIPNSELVVLKNSSHSVLADAGDLFRNTVIDFIQRRVIKSTGDVPYETIKE